MQSSTAYSIIGNKFVDYLPQIVDMVEITGNVHIPDTGTPSIDKFPYESYVPVRYRLPGHCIKFDRSIFFGSVLRQVSLVP
jgi:hypothetical protein